MSSWKNQNNEDLVILLGISRGKVILPISESPLSPLAENNGGYSSSGLLSTCILRSMTSDCCLNRTLGRSSCRLNSSLSDAFLTNGLADNGLSVLRLSGDIRRSPSFLSSLVRGDIGGLPRGIKRLGPTRVADAFSLTSDFWFSLSVLSSSSLSTFVSRRSRCFVFSSDVRSSCKMF